ncbi:MAG: RDD family protein [Rhodobacteraceae bacterium]|nr:RDD family protein [Paracoccaceae bacterium]
MTAAPRYTSALPDPARRPDFYEGVPAKRGAAWGIDMVITAAMAIMALPFTAFTGLFFFPFLMAVIGFFYRWITISAGSATLGMRIMGIELREADGGRLSSGTALFHTLGYMVSFMAAPLQLLSIGLMFGTQRGQGLSDLVLGTTAINRPLR